MLRSSPAVLVIAPAVMLAALAGCLDPLQNVLDDARFRLAATDPSGGIVIADIDAKSIVAEGRWPWPRRIHADLVDRLRELGAAEIAFDVDFSAASAPAEDAAFAAALERAGGTVILAALTQRATADSGETQIVHNSPITSLARHAWVAGADVTPDPDGKVRRLRYSEYRDGKLLPSIAATLGGGEGAVDGDFRVDFGIRADRFDRVSVVDILDANIVRGRIAGKKIVIGASAAELRDYFTVPVYGSISGAALQAMGAESILRNRVLRPTGDLPSFAAILAISMAVLFLFGRLKWFYVIGFAGALSVAVEAAALLVQKSWPLLPATAPVQTAIFCLVLLTLVREIDFRRILLLIAHNQTANARAILDRVIADNFAGVIVIDHDDIIRAASRIAGRILGAPAELVGRKSRGILPPELTEAAHRAIRDADRGAEQNTEYGEIGYPRSDGTPLILEYAVTTSRLSGGPTPTGRRLPDTLVATLTFSDVTEERMAASRIAYLAEYDSLTGLPNRNQILQRLSGVLQAPHNADDACAVVCFDLDRFKNVNDTLGHDVGDLLLKAVAERARGLIAPGDLLGRFGGDEFIVICAGGHASERAAVLAEELMARAGEPFDLGGRRVVVGLSFGIAAAGGDERDPLVVLKHADTALYAAKADGGNRVSFFVPEMAEDLQTRHVLESELWEAVMRREFEIHYQPQIDLASGRIVGMEALLRWHNPRLGQVSPAEFIPVAEALGLIQPLGDWVLEKACAVAAAWPPTVRLAVNVSSIQFVRGDLMKSVETALSRAGLPPERLELEITESLFLQENELIRATLRQIQEWGVTLALDDFGTGYSSLNYLRRFRVDKIKIDRSFIAEMHVDTDSMAIVRAVASLAQNLDIRLNAEGIETHAQLVILKLLGCHEAQGFIFGRPVPEAEAFQLIEASESPSRYGARAS